ncbi:PDR/VanB family oxidoreductase [Roseisalinus antarcticus]|uniref:Phthalate dioxygenase reductase n=1 Tax=Roseisalinus antarcticus TaxID=254357 RepID=A0A1Y5TY24_9RHOB|nr:PDR/VanB family oxidoreductase [Roseisalinus antarcticus]SLN70826.1 Phthalate dioxygenase reductase [Roseisalinus antarcticus]
MTEPTVDLRVAAVAQVGGDVRCFTLCPAVEGAALPGFTAGAHISLHLPSGLVRDYSLCSDPGEAGHWQIAVKREAEGRGGSIEVHDRLEVGETLTASHPRNTFALPDGDGPLLLLSGGIGITPILSMIPALRRAGRRFRLIHLVRDAADVPFADRMVPTGDEDMMICPRGGARFPVGAALAGLGPDWSVQCCGPMSLIEAAERQAAALNWAPGRLRREVFRAEDVAPRDGDAPIRVTIASTGQVVQVAADKTILDALLGAGVDVPFSCEEGTCGTCITRVLDGDPDHRDMVLMPHEKADHITVCCSRAKSAALTLEL